MHSKRALPHARARPFQTTSRLVIIFEFQDSSSWWRTTSKNDLGHTHASVREHRRDEVRCTRSRVTWLRSVVTRRLGHNRREGLTQLHVAGQRGTQRVGRSVWCMHIVRATTPVVDARCMQLKHFHSFGSPTQLASGECQLLSNGPDVQACCTDMGVK